MMEILFWYSAISWLATGFFGGLGFWTAVRIVDWLMNKVGLRP